MTIIELQTEIKAPIELVFDLSRNIDFHTLSASQTQETAIEGTLTGLIGPGETVTWRGKHFGLFLKHTSKIISFERPTAFTDVMIKGYFTYFAHQHIFRTKDNTTHMHDILTYRAPLGILGNTFDRLFLKKHLTKFLQQRNSQIKKHLEQASAS